MTITGSQSLLQVADDLFIGSGSVDPRFDLGAPGAATTATVDILDGARVEVGGVFGFSNAFLADTTVTIAGLGTEVVVGLWG